MTVSDQRVLALAGVLAGFRWPGERTFTDLKQTQRATALAVARMALETMNVEPD